MKLILIIIAIVLALVAAALAFGWFGSNAEGGDILGVLALALASYFAASIAPAGSPNLS